jgi:hypothetical protein
LGFVCGRLWSQRDRVDRVFSEQPLLQASALEIAAVGVAVSGSPVCCQPELDDHVLTVEVEQWVSALERERRRLDPKRAASGQELMRMLWSVCRRAGVRNLSPHQLRHGFANRFLRESGRDVVALQALMGHKRPDTTQQYADDVNVDDLAEVLDFAASSRYAQASPEEATLAATVPMAR